ncbi:HIRAN domain-containing protein [Eubacterium barkeri]|uniref:HIRAN domain-containing protein n=1 Tax=Eubacterium barkeri TaxID=1528 RepID=A0A1H3AX73_EUBBA|nr:HIRAN domain-containing protein [Eubacterium barkeri]SDX34185.1 HIRAN domain-containing protein [Eubacterium barkeri]
MTKIQNKDFLYLVWKDDVTRRQFVVGQLIHNGGYTFNYGLEVEAAIEAGFDLMLPFDDVKKTYHSAFLFPAFSSRLPDRKRVGIEGILKKYKLDSYDEYELLKRSGAKLPIDQFQFIDPIFAEQEKDGEIQRCFYVAGPRYYLGCDGENCEKALHLAPGDSLYLKSEPKNPKDHNAIQILDSDGNRIGYLPRYYCEGVSVLLQSGYEYTCMVKAVNTDNRCDECIWIVLTLKL